MFIQLALSLSLCSLCVIIIFKEALGSLVNHKLAAEEELGPQNACCVPPKTNL